MIIMGGKMKKILFIMMLLCLSNLMFANDFGDVKIDDTKSFVMIENLNKIDKIISIRKDSVALIILTLNHKDTSKGIIKIMLTEKHSKLIFKSKLMKRDYAVAIIKFLSSIFELERN